MQKKERRSILKLIGATFAIAGTNLTSISYAGERKTDPEDEQLIKNTDLQDSTVEAPVKGNWWV